MLPSPPSQPIRMPAGLDDWLGQCAAYDHIESAVAVYDLRGAQRYANPAFARFNLGMRDAPESFGNYESLQACPAFQSWLGNAIRSGNGEPLRRTFYYSPRITLDLSLCLRPLLGRDEQLAGAMLTLGEESIEFGRRHLAQAQESNRSLAQRIKLLDRERIANDKLIRVLLKEAPFAMVLLDAQRKLVQVNRAAEKLFGCTALEMIGRSCDSLLPCFSACNCCPVMDRNARIEAEEIQGTRSDGQTIPLLRSVALVNSDNALLLVEAFVDLTDRKKAERELHKLSEFNKLLVESTGEGIFSVDRDLRCTFSNAAAARMLGYQQEQLLGQDIHALFH